VNVGKRHGKPVVFEISAQNMQKKGFLFYISENKVWLTESVPIDFIKLLEI
jgi:putative RNA 2'-phosphotransferase